MTHEFNPAKVSPSRIGTLADCGWKFKLKYVDGLSPERTGSAALFGKVCHRARERWVVNRQLNLIELMRDAWVEETRDEPVLAAFIAQYAALSGKAIRLEEEIRRARPELKAVRMSRDWKQSPLARQIDRLSREWFPKLAESKYEFRERDPLPALYDESLTLAWKYGERYKHLPNSYVAELPFDFEFEGFRLNGFIDEVAPLIDKDTGERIGIGVVDAKTYRNAPEIDHKDGRQLTIYKLAVEDLRERGVLEFDATGDIYCGIDRMRLGDFRWYKLDDSDVRRLRAELRAYKVTVENEAYLPAAKTCNSSFCDFAKACQWHHGNQGKPLELNVA